VDLPAAPSAPRQRWHSHLPKATVAQPLLAVRTPPHPRPHRRRNPIRPRRASRSQAFTLHASSPRQRWHSHSWLCALRQFAALAQSPSLHRHLRKPGLDSPPHPYFRLGHPHFRAGAPTGGLALMGGGADLAPASLSRGSRRFACGQNRRERRRTGAPRTRVGFWGGRKSAGADAPMARLRPREANSARPQQPSSEAAQRRLGAAGPPSRREHKRDARRTGPALLQPGRAAAQGPAPTIDLRQYLRPPTHCRPAFQLLHLDRRWCPLLTLGRRRRHSLHPLPRCHLLVFSAHLFFPTCRRHPGVS